MRYAFWVIVVGVTVSVMASLFAGEKEKCTAPPEECAAKIQAKLATHGWLGVETESVTDGAWGVTAVVAGSPAEAAGFAVGDVMLAVNGVKLGEKNKDKVAAMKKGMVPGAEAVYVVKRGGEKVKLRATLAKYPDDVVSAIVAKHIKMHHATETQARRK